MEVQRMTLNDDVLVLHHATPYPHETLFVLFLSSTDDGSEPKPTLLALSSCTRTFQKNTG